MSHEISLRPARPTLDDGILFARYLDTSADGLFRLMFGAATERVLAEAYLEPGHDLSFEHVTFAVRGDTVVGMVSAYSSEQHSHSSDGPLKRASGWRIIRLGAVNVMASRLLGFLDDIGDGVFYLQAVAIDADSRGQGLGTALIEHAQTRAMNTTASRLTLHVAVENVGARRLYERLGMHVEATSPKAAPLPGLQVHRMIKPLCP